MPVPDSSWCSTVRGHLVFPNSNSTVERWRRACKSMGNPLSTLTYYSQNKLPRYKDTNSLAQCSIRIQVRRGDPSWKPCHVCSSPLKHWDSSISKWDSEKHLQECSNFNMPVIGLWTMESAECPFILVEPMVSKIWGKCAPTPRYIHGALLISKGPVDSLTSSDLYYPESVKSVRGNPVSVVPITDASKSENIFNSVRLSDFS